MTEPSRAVRVRLARRADLAAVAAIERGCFADPWPAVAFRVALESPADRVHVAEAEGAVVGYALMRGAAGQGELLNIAVATEYRQLGVGGALLDAALRQAARDGIHDLTLEVRRSNAAAIALYARRGFAPVGVRRGYYAAPREDAVVMRRELRPAARNDSPRAARRRSATAVAPDLPSPARPSPRQETP